MIYYDDCSDFPFAHLLLYTVIMQIYEYSAVYVFANVQV